MDSGVQEKLSSDSLWTFKFTLPPPRPAAVALVTPPARSLSLPTGRILSAALLHSLYILTRLHRIFRPVRVFKNLLEPFNLEYLYTQRQNVHSLDNLTFKYLHLNSSWSDSIYCSSILCTAGAIENR